MIATTLEFESRPNEDGTLPIPPGIADQLKGVESVRVIVVLPSSDDADWAALTRDQFLKGYAASDAIYDITHDELRLQLARSLNENGWDEPGMEDYDSYDEHCK